jgi:hypothetical protein
VNSLFDCYPVAIELVAVDEKMPFKIIMDLVLKDNVNFVETLNVATCSSTATAEVAESS